MTGRVVDPSSSGTGAVRGLVCAANERVCLLVLACRPVPLFVIVFAEELIIASFLPWFASLRSFAAAPTSGDTPGRVRHTSGACASCAAEEGSRREHAPGW